MSRQGTEFTVRTTNRLCVLCVAVLFAQPVLGQGRRDGSTRPMLRPKSESPAGPIKRLAITSRAGEVLLYSAGDDKFVREFRLQHDGGTSQLVPTGAVTWPVSRSLEGRIQGMAVQSSDPPWIALGGFGVISPLLGLVDRRDPGNQWALLHPEHAAPHESIGAVAFHPRNQVLAGGHRAFRERGGEATVLFWESGEKPVFLQSVTVPLSEISDLSFSPAGSKLAAFGPGFDGKIHVWELKAGNGGMEIRPLEPVPTTHEVSSLCWLTDTEWAIGTRSDAQIRVHRSGRLELESSPETQVTRIINQTTQPVTYRFVEQDPDRPQPRFDNAITGTINPRDALVRHTHRTLWVDFPNRRGSDGKLPGWTCNAGSKLEIRSLGRRTPDGFEVVELREVVAAPYISGLCFLPESQEFAAAIHSPGEPLPGKVVLKRKDGEITHRLQPEFQSPVTALAVSPAEKLIVAAGVGRSSVTEESEYQIRLWSSETGRLLVQYPQQDASRAASDLTVSPISNVAILPDRQPGRVTLAYGTDAYQRGVAAPLTRRFSLQPTYDWRIDKLPANVAIPRGTGGTDVALQQEGFYLQDGRLGPFPYINGAIPPRCYVRFVAGTLDAVAVGYETGILVWNAGASKRMGFRGFQPTDILRSLFGNEGKVSCLAVSDDATWLVSGSDDGTIAAWSLKGLASRPQPLLELGAEFELVERGQDRLRVRSVAPGSPAHAAGLEKGDEIREMLVVGTVVAPSRWWTELNALVPSREVALKVQSTAGDLRTIRTTITADFLWTLLPYPDGSWVIWTPQGAADRYDTKKRTVAATENLYWHVNPPISTLFLDRQQTAFPLEPVREVPLAYFWDKHHRPREIRELIQTHDNRKLTAFLRDTGRVLDDLWPSLQIKDVPDDLERKQDFVILVQVIRVAQGKTETEKKDQDVTLEIWCNGRRLEERKIGATSSRDFPVTVPQNALRFGQNRIALYTRDGEGRMSPPEIRRFKVDLPDRPPQRRLHYVGVGVTSLEHPWPELRPLVHAGCDAYYIGQALDDMTQRPGAPFSKGRMTVLHSDAQLDPKQTALRPTKENIRAALADVVREARPDDLVCIFLAGHGILDETAGAERKEQEFVFVTEDADAQNPPGTGLQVQKELYGELSKLACPVLVLVDACHSRGVQIDQKLLLNAGGFQFGPQVLLSCQTDETSVEFGKVFKRNDRDIGHGVFSAAIIEALTGRRFPEAGPNAAREPPIANVEVLCQDVTKRVPVLLQLLRDRDVRQGVAGANELSDTQRPQLVRSQTFPASVFLAPHKE